MKNVFCLKVVIFIIISFLNFYSYSQVKVLGDLNCGYYIDINGMPIDGFFDISYSPKNSLNVNYYIQDNQTAGSYKDLNGKLHSGKIKLTSNYKKFEFDDGTNESKIEAGECSGLKIGADTFVIINGYRIPTDFGLEKDKNKLFVKLIKQRDKLSLYKYHYYQFIGGSEVTTYFLKTDTLDSLIAIPKKKELFKAFINNYFGCNAIKKIMEYDALKYSKVSDYIDLYFFDKINKNDRRIYYNRYWDIVTDTSNYVYYAKIIDIKDTVLNFKFYLKNNIPLFSSEIFFF